VCEKDVIEVADCGGNDCIDKSENLYEDDRPHGSHHLARQLKVNEDMIIAALTHFDNTHRLMVDYCWKAQGRHKGIEGELSLVDLQVLKEALVVMKSNYVHLISDRDHLLNLDEIYFDVLRGKEDEVDKLTFELKVTMDFLKSTQMALQESENQVDDLCLELTLAHSSSSIAEIQSSMAATSNKQLSYTKSEN